MTKLFSVLDDIIISTENKEENTLDSKIDFEIENIENLSDSLEYTLEGFKTLSNAFYEVNNTSTLFLKNKGSKREFIASMEQINILIESTLKNLNIKAKLPSLEDFNNDYAFETCKLITLEGFKDWLITIWEKIKKFFKEFFKKINYFYRRILSLNLTLEEYEELIENKIKKIKDNSEIESKIIESKLPVYLANEETTSIDKIYLLTNGKYKIRNLVKEIINLNESLSKIININKNNRLNEIEDINKEKVNILTNGIISILTNNIFKINSDINDDLPLDVYDNFINKLSSSSFDNETETIQIYKMLENQDEIEMPCYLNMYLGTNNSKVIVGIKYEENTHVKKEIKTLTKKSEIEDLYKFHKDMKKDLKLDSISKDLDKHQDIINDIIKEAEKVISNKKKILVNSFGKSTSNEENLVKFFKESLNEFNKDKSKVRFDFNRYESKDNTILFEVNANLKREETKKYSIIFIKENEKFEYISNIDVFIEKLKEFKEDINESNESFLFNDLNVFLKTIGRDNFYSSDEKNNNSQLSNISEEEIQEKIKLLDKIALFYISYMNSIGEIVKILISNHLTIYTKIRYELIKYIYNSIKEF